MKKGNVFSKEINLLIILIFYFYVFSEDPYLIERPIGLWEAIKTKNKE